MKKIIVLLFLFVCSYSFAQVPAEIQTKAQNITAKYQANTSITALQAQEINNLLVTYFLNKVNGTPIAPTVQNQVNNIITVSNQGSGSALTATTVLENVSGELAVTDPVYNRAQGVPFDISCPTQGILSTVGNSVYYDVYEFTVTQAGEFDIEVTSFTEDSYIALYCSFDPLNPLDNLIDTDDDGAGFLLSEFSNTTLPTGTYYLVMSAFENGEAGDYTIQFRSDNGDLVLGSNPVPVSIWWIISLFVLIAAGIVIKKIWF